MDNEVKYKADVLCKNCGYAGEIEIDKGKSINEVFCPKCGCKTIERNYNAHLMKNRQSKTSYF